MLLCFVLMVIFRLGISLRKVVGGISAEEGEFSFMVSLQWKEGMHFCSGNLLDMKTVLTACHCLAMNYNGHRIAFVLQEIIVVGGSVNLRSDQIQRRRIASSVFHEKCHPEKYGWSFDYGLYILKTPFLQYTKIVLKPIPLFSTNRDETMIQIEEMTKSNKSCWSAGWGMQKVVENGSLYSVSSDVLKKINVRLVDRRFCRKSLCKEPKKRCLAETELKSWSQICGMGPEEQDVCEGDSGSPLVCDGFVFALLSWGPACGEYPYPSMYSSIHEILDVWVASSSSSLSISFISWTFLVNKMF